jgi:outer membrane receptor protein involved in Fe transport
MSNKQQSPVVFAKKPSIVATQVALALMAQVAYAQQPVQTTERVERVEVTGTRLPQLSTEGPSPVTVMDAQDIRMDGLTKTEDLLNNLPQVYAAQGSNASNGATGTATVNLRNLGETRNLVLLNGRRMPAGSPRSGTASAAADLNQIPAGLIQRVELLTGGASAVYGSDAITGVVNFIMNDRFEGLQIDANWSGYNHQQQNPNGIADIIAARAATNPTQFAVPGDVGADGQVRGFSVLMGKNFADNKGNATAFFNYKKEDAVLQSQRDFSACSLRPGNTFTCGGSGTSYPGYFYAFGPGGAYNVFTIADAAGNTRPFTGNDVYNFGPLNYYRRPSEQYAGAAFAHLDITPKLRAYTELGFHDNRSLAQIAPSGSFFSQQGIFFENPLLSADEKAQIAAGCGGPFAAPGDVCQLLIGRRNVEGGGRIDDIRHTSYRFVGGVKGEISPGFNYDVFGQTARVIYSNTYLNDFSNVRLGRALDVVAGPGGAPTCRSVVNGTDPNCVPWDIWHIGGVNQAALNYLQTPGLQNGETRLHVFNATLSADLGQHGIKMPGARDGLAVALGYERRKEGLELRTDTQFETGDLAGQGGSTPSVAGQLQADEIFGEARLPLLQRVPFADLLSVNGSYRHSKYSDNVSSDTWGVGGEWAPVRNYRLRGSYSHAIRHANVQELFAPQSNNLVALADPCAGPTPTASAANCARSGVTPAQYGNILANPAGQYNVLTGGNQQLTPETANTATIGLVMNPVRSLTATVDLWIIKIEDAVGQAPAQTTLNNCINAGILCGNVQRDALGTLWILPNGRVNATNQNLGGYFTRGIDLGANWTTRMGNMGGLGLNVIGTYVDTWKFEPIKGLGVFDCAGYVGQQCGTPNPTWRHKARATWATPVNVDLALTWRYIGKVQNEGLSSDPHLHANVAPTDRELSEQNYFDLGASWTINKTFTLRGGINNIFDVDPPIVSGTATATLPALADPSIFGNGNTFPQMYDTLGRLIWVNLTMKF